MTVARTAAATHIGPAPPGRLIEEMHGEDG